MQTISRPRPRPDTPRPDSVLAADWRDVVASTPLDVRRWRRAHPRVFGGCRTADDVLLAIRRHGDAALAVLIAEHLCEHPQAGRIVWHSMLPKMRVMAARDPAATFEDYTGHLWLRLCTYPLTARPVRIAANLALDTLKAVKTDQARATPVAPAPIEPRPQPDEITARRIIQAADELGLIDRETAWMLTVVYADGLSGQDAADRLGLTRTTVRYRCSRTLRRLREHAHELHAHAADPVGA